MGSPIGLPLAASHTRAVLSQEAVTTRWPSGLNCAELTVAFMLQGRANRLAGGGIPHPRRLVPRGGHHPLTIGTELR